MSPDTIAAYATRSVLNAIAANLRTNAATAKDAAASYDTNTDVDNNAEVDS